VRRCALGCVASTHGFLYQFAFLPLYGEMTFVVKLTKPTGENRQSPGRFCQRGGVSRENRILAEIVGSVLPQGLMSVSVERRSFSARWPII
jgi:hypothetical protein